MFARALRGVAWSSSAVAPPPLLPPLLQHSAHILARRALSLAAARSAAAAAAAAAPSGSASSSSSSGTDTASATASSSSSSSSSSSASSASSATSSTGLSLRAFVLSRGRTQTTLVAKSGADRVERHVEQSSVAARMRALVLRSFVPVGYDSDPPPGYFRFASWRAAHVACQALLGVVSTQALLSAAGFPSAAMGAAALNWVLKDGLAQLGTVLVSTRVAGWVDLDPQRWYTHAGVLLTLGFGLESMAPFVPSMFLQVGAAAGVLKGVAFMAFGAAQMALLATMTRMQNFGDVAARAAGQATAASLVGTLVGVAGSSLLAPTATTLVGTFVVVAPVYLACQRRAAFAVPVATVSSGVLMVLAREFHHRSRVFSPADPELRRAREVSSGRNSDGPSWKFGVSLDAMSSSWTELGEMRVSFGVAPFIVATERGSKGVNIALHESADVQDILHAALVAAELETLPPGTLVPSAGRVAEMRTRSAAFETALESVGWQLTRVIMYEELRFRWADEASPSSAASSAAVSAPPPASPASPAPMPAPSAMSPTGVAVPVGAGGPLAPQTPGAAPVAAAAVAAAAMAASVVSVAVETSAAASLGR